jgi:hypothetical protein
MSSNVSDAIFRVWLSIPFLGYIRISTIFTIAILFFYVTWKFKRCWKDAFYQAVVSVSFTLILYEIVFNAVAACIFLKTWESFIQNFMIWHYIMVGGWLILGFRQALRNFVPTKIANILFATCLVAWVLWILIGFPFNVPSDTNLSLPSEVLNIVTKATLLFGYASGLQPNKNESKRTATQIK